MREPGRTPKRFAIVSLIITTAIAIAVAGCGGSTELEANYQIDATAVDDETQGTIDVGTVEPGNAESPAGEASTVKAATPNSNVGWGSGDGEVVNTVATGELVIKVVADLQNAALASESVGPEEFDELIEVYDRFLDDREEVILGQNDRSTLNPVATERAQAQVDELKAIQDEKKAENGIGILAKLNEYSYVSSIQIDGDRRVFLDCTERHREFDWGNQAIYFVTNRVEMVPGPNGYQVDSMTVLHDGIIHEVKGDYGCATPYMAQEAANAAAQAITEVAVAIGDPQAALDRGFSDVFSDETGTQLVELLNALERRELHRQPDDLVELRVAGMHVHKPEFTIVVSVCRTFPNGRQFVDSASGEPGEMEMAPGSSEQEWLLVQLDVSGDDAHQVTEVIPQGPGCDAPYAGAQ